MRRYRGVEINSTDEDGDDDDVSVGSKLWAIPDASLDALTVGFAMAFSSNTIDDDASKVSTHNPHAKRTGYVLRKLGGLNKLGNEITYFMRLLKNPIRASQKLLWGLW
uniref:Uncharacterized protein n=1 Tax=Zea mays TaxID=4577 RepID=A0A804RCC4_MAIZE